MIAAEAVAVDLICAAVDLSVDLVEMHDAEAIDLTRWPNAAALVAAVRRLTEPAPDPVTRPVPEPTEADPQIAEPLGPRRREAG